MEFDKYCSNLEVECRFRNNDDGSCINKDLCAFKEKLVLGPGEKLMMRYLMTLRKQQQEILQRLEKIK